LIIRSWGAAAPTSAEHGWPAAITLTRPAREIGAFVAQYAILMWSACRRDGARGCLAISPLSIIISRSLSTEYEATKAAPIGYDVVCGRGAGLK